MNGSVNCWSLMNSIEFFLFFEKKCRILEVLYSCRTVCVAGGQKKHIIYIYIYIYIYNLGDVINRRYDMAFYY